MQLFFLRDALQCILQDFPVGYGVYQTPLKKLEPDSSQNNSTGLRKGDWVYPSITNLTDLISKYLLHIF